MDDITKSQTARGEAFQPERIRLESVPNKSCTVQPVSDEEGEPALRWTPSSLSTVSAQQDTTAQTPTTRAPTRTAQRGIPGHTTQRLPVQHQPLQKTDRQQNQPLPSFTTPGIHSQTKKHTAKVNDSNLCSGSGSEVAVAGVRIEVKLADCWLSREAILRAPFTGSERVSDQSGL